MNVGMRELLVPTVLSVHCSLPFWSMCASSQKVLVTRFIAWISLHMGRDLMSPGPIRLLRSSPKLGPWYEALLWNLFTSNHRSVQIQPETVWEWNRARYETKILNNMWPSANNVGGRRRWHHTRPMMLRGDRNWALTEGITRVNRLVKCQEIHRSKHKSWGMLGHGVSIRLLPVPGFSKVLYIAKFGQHSAKHSYRTEGATSLTLWAIRALPLRNVIMTASISHSMNRNSVPKQKKKHST